MIAFGTGLNIEYCPNFADVVAGLLSGDLAVILEVRLGADQEEDGFLVGILAGLLDPLVETVEAALVVDAEDQEDAANSLVEGAHDGPEGLLARLNIPTPTVSQICILTVVSSSMRTVLDWNSTPTVTL